MEKKMKIIKYALIILVFVISIVEARDGRDIIIVVDNSGSMWHVMKYQKKDDENIRVNTSINDSIKKFIELLSEKHPDDRVGLIKFQRESTILIPLSYPKDILNNDISNVFKQLDYSGKWTIFKSMFIEAYKALGGENRNNWEETYIALITDGVPSQSNSSHENKILTDKDVLQTNKWVKSYLYSKGITLYAMPFLSEKRLINQRSKSQYIQDNVKYLKKFVTVAAGSSKMSEKPILKGKDIYTKLESYFIFHCNDFPGNEPVQFTMGITFKDEPGIFYDVYELAEHRLKSTYEDIKFRKVKINRKIMNNMPWDWDKSNNKRKLKNLLQKYKINGLCLIQSTDAINFKFRIAGCDGNSEDVYCVSPRPSGYVEDLADQFVSNYLEMEKHMLQRLIDFDKVPLEFYVERDHKTKFLYPLSDLNCRLKVLDKRADQYKDELNNDSVTGNEGKMVFYNVPRGVPYKIEVFPANDMNFEEKPLTQKAYKGGWNSEPTKNRSILTIENNDENFPEIIVFGYAKKDEKSDPIGKRRYGNVKFDLSIKPIDFENNYQDIKVKIESDRSVIPKLTLLRGSTYKYIAKLDAYLDQDIKKFIRPNLPEYSDIDESNLLLRHFHVSEGLIVGGEFAKSIPFLLNMHAILFKKLLENNDINSIYREVLDFLKPYEYSGYHSFKFSKGNDVFDLVANVSNKLQKLEDKKELWCKLHNTKYSCKHDNRYGNQIQEYATAIILKYFISETSVHVDQNEDTSKQETYTCIPDEGIDFTIRDIKSDNLNKFQEIKTTAKALITRLIEGQDIMKGVK